MWTRKNKTRLWEWDFTIQKPMANDIVMRNWLFVAIKDWYIIPADGTTEIEGCAINDRYSGENNEHRYCIYQPKRNWETFTMEVDNWTITQADVGKVFRIADSNLQHINYLTKADRGWQFRLEEVLNDNLWTFTYCFDVQFAPQGPQGNDWDTPSLEMGTVTKLQPDENPTADLIPDPNNPNKYILNLGLPSWATWPRWQKGDQGDKWNTGSAWQDWANGINWQDWQDGANWISPHYEGDWNGWTTYTALAIVRYPDSNNEYWTWFTNTASVWETPWVSSNRQKMNKDGEPGPQGEQGWTIVIPVEWKPGKDGIWVDGKDWDPGISPHDEWIRSSTKNYSPLAMVRAFTWEYNVFGDEIRGYYITQNWAYGSDPQDWGPRQLVVKDWNWVASVKDYVDDFKKNAIILVKATWQTVTKTFSNGWVMEPETVTFSNYFWTNSKIGYSGTGIIIKKTWYYRLFAHTILQCNPSTNTPYINMWRMSIYKNWNIALWTSKMWWPFISTQVWSWLWLDLTLDVQLPLFEGDTLRMLTRCQSDADNADWNTGNYVIIGQNDDSGQSGSGSLGWAFATYMWVQMITDDLTDMTWWVI